MVEAVVKDTVSEGNEKVAWALKLFSKSPLKQQKFENIGRFLPNTQGLSCLDIGSDNGVISYLLRQRGGTWHSCDLIPETVESIRSLVGDRVEQVDGRVTPYADGQFDLVIIVDFLEHIETDQEFMLDLARIIKPGGTLLINVPNPDRSITRWFKLMLGQTDAAHGHLRPGYCLDELQKLCGNNFTIEKHASYWRFFSDLVDLAITAGLDFLIGGRGAKGSVVTGTDMKRLQKSFKLYSLIYPFVNICVKLDKIFPVTHGHMLLVKAQRTSHR